MVEQSAIDLKSYSRELETAVEAALDAGKKLREEFNRPNGPRGANGHAPVDSAAEQVIRDALKSAFPQYGVRGEELGDQDCKSVDMQNHLWLLDPNDGTSSFLKGYRGAAVSIALLRNGTPVLGVVYAYVAPDDGGDLFAWAEGCGSPRRNNVPIARRWSEKLQADHTIFVSQDADKNSPANAAVITPARFRTLPSIAYRLALVAAGDGEAGISLNRPQDWDYAAGHALLRGSGGELSAANAKSADNANVPPKVMKMVTRHHRSGGTASVSSNEAPAPATELPSLSYYKQYKYLPMYLQDIIATVERADLTPTYAGARVLHDLVKLMIDSPQPSVKHAVTEELAHAYGQFMQMPEVTWSNADVFANPPESRGARFRLLLPTNTALKSNAPVVQRARSACGDNFFDQMATRETAPVGTVVLMSSNKFKSIEVIANLVCRKPGSTELLGIAECLKSLEAKPFLRYILPLWGSVGDIDRWADAIASWIRNARELWTYRFPLLVRVLPEEVAKGETLERSLVQRGILVGRGDFGPDTSEEGITLGSDPQLRQSFADIVNPVGPLNPDIYSSWVHSGVRLTRKTWQRHLSIMRRA